MSVGRRSSSVDKSAELVIERLRNLDSTLYAVVRRCVLGKDTYSPFTMIKTKVPFLEEGRLFSSQSELFEYLLNCSDWLVKSRPSKKATFVLIIVNRL